jgi:hypothetical protein
MRWFPSSNPKCERGRESKRQQGMRYRPRSRFGLPLKPPTCRRVTNRTIIRNHRGCVSDGDRTVRLKPNLRIRLNAA